MRNLLINQSGFSLIQGMVIAGVLAGSGLVATRMLSDQKMAMKGAETRDQVDQLHSLVYAAIQNKDHCFATVTGASSRASVSTALVNNLTNPTVPDIITASRDFTGSGGSTVYTKSGTVVQKDGVYMNGNVKVNKIQFLYPAPAPLPTATNPSPVAPGDGIAYLQITYERLKETETSRTKSGYGAKDLMKTIVVRMQRRPDLTSAPYDNLFEGCYGITENITTDAGNKDLAKEMCQALNSTGNSTMGKSLFTWDETTSTCVPKDQTCKLGGYVNTGINSNGEVECRRLQDWVDMNKFIDNSSPTPCSPGKQAQLQYDSTNNKVKIVCF